MKKEYINVPENIYFLGNYPDLLNKLPTTGCYILNKVMTGCGATTLFLEDPVPTVLCSPRCELIRCKVESERFRGLLHDFGGITSKKKLNVIDKINAMRYYLTAFKGIPKILVTYDSCKYVIQGLYEMGILENFRFVIDEFQTLMTDAAFRGDVEVEFTQNLKSLPSVIFLSATPILDTYLEILPDFQDIPYFELVWPDSSKHATDIQWKNYYNQSRTKTMEMLIERYLRYGYFETTKDPFGNDFYATEAVFFVNEIKFIILTVKKLQKYGVPLEEINVICARNDDNAKALARVGLEIGYAPGEGEKHPVFTFATKASYEGADFYSTIAYTYIFSDVREDNMAVDISLDLPQIMGRQRLEQNPFKYSATFYFLTIPEFSEAKRLEFINTVNVKRTETEKDIQNFSHSTNPIKDARRIRNSQIIDKYKYDYTSVVDDKISNQPRVVMNWYVMANELRAWEVQSSQYRNCTYVMGASHDAFSKSSPVTHSLVIEFLNGFSGTFSELLEKYSLFLDAHPECTPELMGCVRIPKNIKEYYSKLGTEKLRGLSWSEPAIKIAMNMNPSAIESDIRSAFISGSWYSLKEIKQVLQGIYDKNQYSCTAKATDITNYIQCTEKKKVNNGKRDNGYLIL